MGRFNQILGLPGGQNAVSENSPEPSCDPTWELVIETARDLFANRPEKIQYPNPDGKTVFLPALDVLCLAYICGAQLKETDAGILQLQPGMVKEWEKVKRVDLLPVKADIKTILDAAMAKLKQLRMGQSMKTAEQISLFKKRNMGAGNLTIGGDLIEPLVLACRR